MSRIESYSDALNWLFQRNQFAIKLGLEAPRELMQALGNPERDGVYLHVAGTNGKGSVCANLAALLPLAGYRRVGLYTSPHLVSFRERIRVNGMPVPPAWVAQWMQRSQPVMEKLNSTYFECVTAMAFAYFHEQGCDAVVLETGLGGRLDATNIITPRVTVITSISLDHTAMLGNTVEEIWGEKLGIAKPGVPLIIDEARPALAKLAQEKADALHAPLINLADQLQIPSEKSPKNFETDIEKNIELRGPFGRHELPLNLRAESHQTRNAALSLLAFETFLGKPLPPRTQWLPVLQNTKVSGRTQWLQGDGLIPVLLDGAHNPSGVEALCNYLREHGNEYGKGRARFFFAVMRDKDFAGLYRELHSISEEIAFIDLTGTFPRALTLNDLREALTEAEQKELREVALSWNALEPLLQPGGGADYAVFCGSLYLLGEIIPVLLPHYRGLEEFANMMEEEK